MVWILRNTVSCEIITLERNSLKVERVNLCLLCDDHSGKKLFIIEGGEG